MPMRKSRIPYLSGQLHSHFYTTDANERDSANQLQFNNEGTCCTVATPTASNTEPLYRAAFVQCRVSDDSPWETVKDFVGTGRRPELSLTPENQPLCVARQWLRKARRSTDAKLDGRALRQRLRDHAIWCGHRLGRQFQTASQQSSGQKLLLDDTGGHREFYDDRRSRLLGRTKRRPSSRLTQAIGARARRRSTHSTLL